MSEKLGTLLIVDDEKYITNMVAILMRGKTDITLKANNGKEALDLIEKNEVHCILSDIMMPKMNGVELIKEIRKLGIKIPFIFYTAFGNEKLMMEAFKCGAFDFLEKPALKNLESVLIKGLQHGLKVVLEGKKGEDGEPVELEFDQESFKSEYQKMVSQKNSQEK